METRRIDDAISLLSRAESWILNRARTNDDYSLARTLREAAKDAEKELHNLHRGHTPSSATSIEGEPYQEPLECYCDANNAPCNWCEAHCVECQEELDECSCA
jgi:hypothetical protein